MTPIRMKLIGAGLVIAGAAAVLAFSGMRDGWVYFLPVDEFVAKEAESGGRYDSRVRLHGKVGSKEFAVDRAGLEAQFELCGTAHSLRVAYTGVIPEMFDAGRDVVVEGHRDANGLFVADTLMTKCASKYESGDGQAPHADPHADPLGGDRPEGMDAGKGVAEGATPGRGSVGTPDDGRQAS